MTERHLQQIGKEWFRIWTDKGRYLSDFDQEIAIKGAQELSRNPDEYSIILNAIMNAWNEMRLERDN